MTGLSTLIEELENAREGSRGLDARIAVMADYDYTDVHGWKFIEVFWYFRSLTASDIDSWHVPHYTTSLDAALMLVPEGLSASATQHGNGRGSAEIWRWAAEKFATDPEDMKRRNGSFTHQNIGAATPALALCIASLRAREQMAEESRAQDSGEHNHD